MQPEVTYCGFALICYSYGGGNQQIPRTNGYQPTASIHHKLLPDVVTVLESLHKLLRKIVKWEWLEEEKMAFQKAKELLTYFNPEKELILARNSSDYGVGAVPSHKLDNGTERSIG